MTDSEIENQVREKLAQMPSWDKVLSPRVWTLVLGMVGKPITPESFQAVMKNMRNELSLPEQIEFLMVQLIFSKAPQ